MPWRPKDGVDLSRLRPELERLEPVVCSVYDAFQALCVVTSTYDGVHKEGSFHPLDAAIDLRVNHLGGGAEQQRKLHAAVKRQVDLLWPGEYDVLLEDPGGPRAHIHIEPSPVLVARMFPQAAGSDTA